jgi:hypothetical protein
MLKVNRKDTQIKEETAKLMSVSGKLTFLVFVLPVFFLSSFFAFGFYFYRNSFDATSFFTAVSGFFSSLVINLLVWERLRESLSEKMKYLDENVFIGLYDELENGDLFSYQPQKSKRALDDLRKYGKFLIITSYPKNLIEQLETFVQLHSSFYEKKEQIFDIAKQLGANPCYSRTLFRDMGIIRDVWETSAKEELDKSQSIAVSMQKENSKLIDENKAIFEKMGTERKRALELLENFLKTNNLRMTKSQIELNSHGSFGVQGP